MDATSSETASLKSRLIQAIPRLRRFAISLTKSAADGDDLVQIALEKAIKNIAQWTPGTSVESWLLRIAYNAWIDEVRGRKRKGPHVQIDALNDPRRVDGAQEMNARQELARVQEAMNELPEEFRSVLFFVAVEGMSYRETAELLKIPVGTVMSRLSRARQNLLRILEPNSDLPNG
jgi:RNA polymerase sigma-70 factor, ECF subfamily